jgi:tetratricopeptide (TPR) repeat protein
MARTEGDGAAVVSPSADGLMDVAILLWIGLRRTAIWTSEGERPPRARTATEVECAEVLRATVPNLEQAVQVLADLREAPHRITRAEVTDACKVISQWAEESGFLLTALLYAETAAAIQVSSARLANDAGRLCRSAGYYARAEIWYERAIGLARVAKDGEEYIRGYLGWGSLLRDRGDHHLARPKIKRAAMNAKRAGLKGKAAEALHDVFTIELLTEDFARAAVMAKRALAVYPRHHRRYPYMAADFAALLVRRGLYQEAHAILAVVMEKLTSPVEKLQVWGLIAWAAGGLASEAMFAEAIHQVRSGAKHYPLTAPGALYGAGEGARLFQDWKLAAACAMESRRAAEVDNDLLTSTFARCLESLVVQQAPGPPELSSDDLTAALLRRLSEEILERLEKWRGPTWRPRRHAAAKPTGIRVDGS